MQQVVNDKLKIAIPFLGGVDEQVEVLEQPPEQFLAVSGVFPQFSGMLARMPGKVGMRKETSPIRSIHQAFASGSFGFYIESDRLVYYNDCANPRYTVKPAIPTNLGTDDNGFTLDIFGGATQGLGVPLSVPDLSFSPRCIPQQTITEPPDEVAPDYAVQTDFFNYNHAVFISLDHGDGFLTDLYDYEGGGVFYGPGEVYNYMWWLSEFLGEDDPPILRMRIQEGTGVDTKLGFATLQPPGSLEISDDNIITPTEGHDFRHIAVEFTIEPIAPAALYKIETGSFPGDIGDEVQIDYIYESHYFAGQQYICGTDFQIENGSTIDFTEQLLGKLTYFGQPLKQFRVYIRVGGVKQEWGVEFSLLIPGSSLVITAVTPQAPPFFQNVTIVDPDYPGEDWPDLTCILIFTEPNP